MNGFLFIIRMMVLHPELNNERLLTTLMLWTADFVESQPFALRIVIFSYYFKGESWSTAIKKIGATNSTDVATRICEQCFDWDRTHMIKHRKR